MLFNFPDTWIYRIHNNYVYHPKNVRIQCFFESEWLILNPVGNSITVKAEYAWNGCSPVVNFFDLFTLGTPEGRINIKTGKPWTYHASLVHDALCQYLDEHDLSTDEVTAIFEELLNLNGRFRSAPLYVAAVTYFGPKKNNV